MFVGSEGPGLRGRLGPLCLGMLQRGECWIFPPTNLEAQNLSDPRLDKSVT